MGQVESLPPGASPRACVLLCPGQVSNQGTLSICLEVWALVVLLFAGQAGPVSPSVGRVKPGDTKLSLMSLGRLWWRNPARLWPCGQVCSGAEAVAAMPSHWTRGGMIHRDEWDQRG